MDDSVFGMFNEETFEPLEDVSNSIDEEGDSTYATVSVVNELNPDKIFVISLGGSVVIKDSINSSLLAKFSEKINSLMKLGYRFVLVVGGGRTARNYVAGGKALGANNFVLDEIGIQATRLNAKLTIQAFEKAFPEVLTNINKAKTILQKGLIPVFGGLLPGITTDCVSALIAESLGGKFVNLSNVDGVYSADPTTHSNAKFYDSLTHNELIKIVGKSVAFSAKPSQNVVLDLPCCLVLKRSNIKAFILGAKDLENFENAIKGYDFKGTIVSSEKNQTEEQITKIDVADTLDTV